MVEFTASPGAVAKLIKVGLSRADAAAAVGDLVVDCSHASW